MACLRRPRQLRRHGLPVRSADSPASQPSPRCPAAPVAAGDAGQRKPPEKRLSGRRAALVSSRLVCGAVALRHCLASGRVRSGGQPMPGDAADYSTTRLLQSRWLAPRSSCQSDWADSDQTRRVISEPTRRMITDPTRQRIAAPTRTQAAIADHINGSAQKFWDDPTGTVISDRTLRRVITDLSSDPSR